MLQQYCLESPNYYQALDQLKNGVILEVKKTLSGSSGIIFIAAFIDTNIDPNDNKLVYRYRLTNDSRRKLIKDIKKFEESLFTATAMWCFQRKP